MKLDITKIRRNVAQRATVTENLFPLGDDFWSYIDVLRTEGFSAFSCELEYPFRYCQSGEDNDLRRYMSEVAKEIIGDPCGEGWYYGLQRPAYGYVSPYLEQLRVAHDNLIQELLGRGLINLDEGPQQANRQITPVLKRMWDEFCGQIAEGKFISPWMSLSKEERRKELVNVPRFEFDLNFNSVSQRAMLIKMMLLELLHPLGFKYNEKQSTEQYPVFTRMLNDQWNLCFAFRDADRYIHSEVIAGLPLVLQIRPINAKPQKSRLLGHEFLTISWDRIHPTLFTSYFECASKEEMEVCLRAKVRLFSLMQPQLEKIVGEHAALLI